MPFRDDLRPDRLVALEEEILATWDRERTFEESLRARKDAEPWVFYEGPPTANGKPGLHHLISRAIKDFACRLETMKGRLVERKAGWDTHGLPVEIETEKRLGLEGKGKAAIEEFGIAEFNRECRASVFRYLEAWQEFTRRSGYWVDLSKPYVTCSNEYVESLWAILAELHGRGLLFKGHKVLPYCPRCETPLSSHELGQPGAYRDVQDPSVFVRFRALASDGSEEDASYLVWTTTPWTLPSNVALAVHPDVEYVKVRVGSGEGRTETLWLAKARLAALAAKSEPTTVLETVKGSALVGRRYRRLLDYYDVASTPTAFTIRPADFVTTEDGTGIVHMAPAYGEDDASVGRRDGLPTIHPIDARGRFVDAPRASIVAGKFVKEADKEVLRDLKAKGSLFRQETIVHAYPHCWRCDSPLLYYARDSWYLRTTQFRDEMVRLNAATRWYPPSTGTGRMGQWLESNVDWALSRDRYWGTPLPLWICDRCRHEEAIGSVSELESKAGTPLEPRDLHRPYVDVPTWACTKPDARCGGTMRRVTEVVDVWFDSGSMPFAQWHYPFEERERVEREVPAAFVAEAIDQTRGWFYTLLAVAVMYRGKPAYRSVACNDLILDAKGKKMSKSRGNTVDPMAIMAKYGADVARWHLLASRPFWLPIKFDEQDLVETRNRLFGTLASTYQFFAMYAKVDGFDGASPPPDWKPADVFDRWLLSRVASLSAGVDADLADLETAKAGKRISDFVVDDLSTWYVRRNRRRFWKGAMTEEKRDGYRTLHAALLTVARLMAPFAPFFPDALHRALLPNLAGAGASVHLADWPKPRTSDVDPALEREMDALRTVVSLGHAARNRAGVKVRQPLERITTGHADPAVQRFLETHRAVVLDELNVKSMDLVKGFGASARLRAALRKKDAAPRLGAKTTPVEKAVAALSESDAARFAAALARDGAAPLALEGGDVVRLEERDVAFTPVDDGGGTSEYAHGILVRLDTAVSPALAAEGLAREFVHGLQGLRKGKGLQVTDRVRIAWSATGPLAEAIRAHGAYVSEEVLATDLREAPGIAGDALEVDGSVAQVVLERASA
jgi:isoleucyl-tRNA synthetase